VKLRLGRRVITEIERKESWWARNRPAAPDLFARELRDTLEFVRTMPGGGIGWPTARRPTLRRILMVRTQNHLFFMVDDSAQAIDVLAIWGASRKRAPKL
jgi:plasmid stabilization system protein ParE